MKTSLYTPYGAFEMKATYQRNLMFGTLAVTGLVAVVLLVAALYPQPEPIIIEVPPNVTETVVDLTNRLRIHRTSGSGGVKPLSGEVVPGAIPVPLPDERFEGIESPMIASQSELADFGLPTFHGDGEPGVGGGGNGGGIVIDTGVGLWPDKKDFIPVEIPPEMIQQYHGEYPRVIRDMGLTGEVLVQALIDEEGHVLVAELARSSGVAALDEVAVKWAKQCLFSPAIQNGRPVKIWVYFTYEFVLD